MGGRLGANFSINVAGLQKGLQTANNLITQTKNKFQTSGDEIAKTGAKFGALEGETNTLRRQLELMRNQLANQNSELIQLQKQGLDGTSKKYNNLDKAILSTETQISKLEKKIQSNNAEMGELKTKLKSVGDTAQASATGFSKFTAPLATMKSKAESAFGGFSKYAGIAKGAGAAMGAAVSAVAIKVATTGKALFNAAKETAEYGAEVSRNAQKIGISNKAYQEWDYVLQRSGTSMDKMKIGMKTLSKTIVEAGNGSNIAAKKLEAVGLSVDDLQGKSQEVQFETVIKALQGMGSSAERTAAATALFGKTGVEMGVLLNKSAADVEKLKNEAEMYGLVMSDEAIEKSKEFSKQLSLMSSVTAAAKRNIAAELLPGLTDLMAGFNGVIAGVDGASDKVKTGVESLATSIAGVVPKLTQLVITIAQGVLAAAPKIVESLANGILNALPMLIGMLPQIVSTCISMIFSVVNAISAHLPQIVSAVMQVIPQLINSLIGAVPQFIAAAVNIVSGVLNSLPALVQGIIDFIPTIIEGIISAIVEGIPLIMDSILNLINSILDTLPTLATQLFTAIPTIITGIITAILEGIPKLLEAAVQLLMGLVNAIPQIIVQLVLALPKIITSIVQTLVGNVGQLIKAGVALFMGLIKAIPQIIIQLVSSLPQIITSIVDGLSDAFSQIFDVGVNLLKGLWEGIKSWASELWENIKDLGNSIIGWFEDIFDEHSPSKIMRKDIGWNLGKGLALGIEDSYDKFVKGSITKVGNKINKGFATDVNATIAGKVAPITAGATQQGVVINQTNNYSQAHSRYEIYKSKKQTAAAVRLAMGV